MFVMVWKSGHEGPSYMAFSDREDARRTGRSNVDRGGGCALIYKTAESDARAAIAVVQKGEGGDPLDALAGSARSNR